MTVATVRELLADLFRDAGAGGDRPDSPVVRPVRVGVVHGISPRSPDSPAPEEHRPFWAVFGLGGPSACWRVTGADGKGRIVAVDPKLTVADMSLSYSGCRVDQLFTEEERMQLLAVDQPDHPPWLP